MRIKFIFTLSFHYIKCLKESSEDKQEFMFKEVISILPMDMLKLMSLREDQNISLRLVDLQLSNPMFSNGNIFEPCGSMDAQKPKEPINVLVIQLEAMSLNHFIRMFPMTYEYLNSSLDDNTLFSNLMINGENTIPNTYAFFAGVIERREHLSLYKLDYNNFPLIWKDFEKLKYISMYNEDFLINSKFYKNIW